MLKVKRQTWKNNNERKPADAMLRDFGKCVHLNKRTDELIMLDHQKLSLAYCGLKRAVRTFYTCNCIEARSDYEFKPKISYLQ